MQTSSYSRCAVGGAAALKGEIRPLAGDPNPSTDAAGTSALKVVVEEDASVSTSSSDTTSSPPSPRCSSQEAPPRPKPADEAYDLLRAAAGHFCDAGDICRWLAYLVRQRAAWDASTGTEQPRLKGEELLLVRAALNDALAAVVGARLNFKTTELEPLREAVRSAKADLDAIAGVLEAMP